MANKRIDRETGELEDENYEERLTFNYHNVSNETGEPEINVDVGEFNRRVPFKVNFILFIYSYILHNIFCLRKLNTNIKWLYF